jgi:hypothetical protein
VFADIGRSRATDYFHIADQLTREETNYLVRTRQFVDDEVLPVMGTRRVSLAADQADRDSWHRGRRHPGLRLSVDEPDVVWIDPHRPQPG